MSDRDPSNNDLGESKPKQEEDEVNIQKEESVTPVDVKIHPEKSDDFQNTQDEQDDIKEAKEDEILHSESSQDEDNEIEISEIEDLQPNPEIINEGNQDLTMEVIESEIKEIDENTEEFGDRESNPTEFHKEEISQKEDTNEEVLPPKKLSGHTLPKEETWILKRNKAGFTLPKQIRDGISPEQNFALVVKDSELIFYMVNEEDIPNLNLVKSKKKTAKEKKGDKRGREKTPIGPQPEWGKYFLFEFEESNKVQEILETAFTKFAENPPNIQEGMDIVKYVLVSFVKSSRMNDSRLRQAVLFFLCDVVEKFNLSNLIDFITDKIIPDIKSRFLYQLSLNQMSYTSFKVKRYEKAQEFIKMCIIDIEKYTSSENYAIMDSFKNLIVKLTRDVDFLIPQDQFVPIRDKLLDYHSQMDDNDYKLQIVDLLDRMSFTDEAYNIAQEVFKILPEDSITREEVKELMKQLEKKEI